MVHARDRRRPDEPRFAGLLGLVCLAATGIGCSIDRDLRAEDEALVPSFRAIWRFEEEDPLEAFLGGRSERGPTRVAVEGDVEREGAAEGGGASPSAEPVPARPRSIAGFELDFAFVSGRDDQDVPGGESIRLDNRTFDGPVTLSHDFDLTLGGVAYRGGARVGGGLEAEALVGVGGTWLRIESDGGGQDDDLSEGSYGALVGAVVTWLPEETFGGGPVAFSDRFELYGRTSWIVGFVAEDTRVLTWEVGARARIFRELGIFAAYRDIDYRLDNGRKSDVSVEVAGPAIGVELRL